MLAIPEPVRRERQVVLDPAELAAKVEEKKRMAAAKERLRIILAGPSDAFADMLEVTTAMEVLIQQTEWNGPAISSFFWQWQYTMTHFPTHLDKYVQPIKEYWQERTQWEAIRVYSLWTIGPQPHVRRPFSHAPIERDTLDEQNKQFVRNGCASLPIISIHHTITSGFKQ